MICDHFDFDRTAADMSFIFMISPPSEWLVVECHDIVNEKMCQHIVNKVL